MMSSTFAERPLQDFVCKKFERDEGRRMKQESKAELKPEVSSLIEDTMTSELIQGGFECMKATIKQENTVTRIET